MRFLGLDETTDQMIVSINAPKAVVEEEPIVDDEAEGEAVEAASEDGEDSSSDDADEGSGRSIN